MYKNEEYLKKIIMNQNRHLFVYGYNTQERSEFLKCLEKNYPFTYELLEPVALYFDSFGLPKIDTGLKNKDSYMIQAMSREYLSFLVASRILEKTIEFYDSNLDDKLSWLIHLININKNRNYDEITTVKKLLNEFKISRSFYYESFVKYVNGLIDNIPIENITIPFLDLGMFVNQYKSCMNMQSYFGLIFDKKNESSIFSTQSINSFIGARINNDISVKVAIEPNAWETYRNVNGQLIEAVHDYGVVELDDSNKDYINSIKLTKKFN